ncbi:fimbria/pilus outer membrane usher protein [Buttiauxella warmboldiae]|uniref:fimbria/pilus outer membrane usher protein n=1 Tax=Buttiauxella warmboldiae TaxID=82993 RepID=UPI001FC9D142|nr:fimbria/pilus outer membrane usher protein [Buttiauxella warmboldiae]
MRNKKQHSSALACSALPLAIFSGALLFAFSVRQAQADDYFDPAALEITPGQQQASDLSDFSQPGGQRPGSYRVTVFVNQQQAGARELEFISHNNQLVPLVDVKYLRALGVNTAAFSSFDTLRDGESFSDLGKYIPDASSQFDFATQRLDFSIPQAAMVRKSRGYVAPEKWDEGIPAAFVDYTLNGSTTSVDNLHDSDNYLNLRSGLNLGAWRLRNFSSYEFNTTGHWQTQGTSLERDIRVLKSELTLGDSYTSGEVFDSFQFTGMKLASDENMLPDSQRGFAPTIRGVAHSNARITVRQHGYVIYETYVAPGAFVINDLFPTAQSGDLEVTIRESDGSERKFTQPYSAVAFMLREGRFKFSASVGRYNTADSDGEEPNFVQASAFYGLPWSLTAYGGAQISNHYQALAFGLGQDIGEFGSLGLDTTLAKTDLGKDGQYTGQAVRAQYQKDFATVGTSLNISGYRYSSRRFYTFAEANEYRDPDAHVSNRRSRTEMSLTQDFGKWGNLSAGFYRQQYWNTSAVDQTVHLGYYNSFRGVSWSLGYYVTRSYYDDKDNERSVNLTVSVPLSRWLPGGSASYSLNNNLDGHTTQQMSLYGTALDNSQLSYNLQQGFDNQNHAANSNVSLDYRGGFGDVSVGYSHDRYSDRLNYGASGGIVATQYGVTLSQSLGDTIGLVRADGTSDVQVEGAANVHTDSRGYAVMPTLSPYHENTLSLDTETLGDDVDLEQNSQTVVPTSGAVVLAHYKTHVGARVLLSLSWHGRPLPFGTGVFVAGQGEVKSSKGIVGERGQVYLSGVPPEGVVHAQWLQNSQSYQCTAALRLPVAASGSPVRLLSAQCQ